MEKQMVQIIPYLGFSGNCEQALNTYLAAFGGEMLHFSRWSEDTCETPEQIGKVMHAECLLGTTRMAAGDTFDTQQNQLKLMVHMGSAKDALHAIDILAKSGTLL